MNLQIYIIRQEKKFLEEKEVEYAMHNFCAVESGHEIIITRNTKDYKESELSIIK